MLTGSISSQFPVVSLFFRRVYHRKTLIVSHLMYNFFNTNLFFNFKFVMNRMTLFRHFIVKIMWTFTGKVIPSVSYLSEYNNKPILLYKYNVRNDIILLPDTVWVIKIKYIINRIYIFDKLSSNRQTICILFVTFCQYSNCKLNTNTLLTRNM